MSRTLRAALLVVLLSAGLCGPARADARPARDTLDIDVTDARRLFTRRVAPGLVLRVVKERSASHANFGWRLEVVRAPYRKTSPNLLYQNRAGHGADPSQVYAWHVSEAHFPDVRELKVRGRPYVVRVELLDCRVEGGGPEARFVSGRLKISWGRAAR